MVLRLSQKRLDNSVGVEEPGWIVSEEIRKGAWTKFNAKHTASFLKGVVEYSRIDTKNTCALRGVDDDVLGWVGQVGLFVRWFIL
ncbi:hypothetical protein GCM10007094_30240 [Pseudovibrio japonicus]|uniref:Uncharacterized protein n=1 Tax=Pseudovibrio japonicus TaxID=366534 RepID=A0ABQ3EIJ8_9HYPH|nr:hypothetical protein GCM10007094_30240 [Pseudovibrio japonicus]